jgi:hypothetical protein
VGRSRISGAGTQERRAEGEEGGESMKLSLLQLKEIIENAWNVGYARGVIRDHQEIDADVEELISLALQRREK